MYIITGFIQTILILTTQAQYMPDMSGIWEEPSVHAETVHVLPGSNRYNLQHGYALADVSAAVPVQDDPLLPPVANPEDKRLPEPPLQNLSFRRVIERDKLYLMFCQLKIGG